MKRVKLQLTCTYNVGITMDIPDNICERIKKCYENNNGQVNYEKDYNNDDVSIVSDYLADHISEKDGDGSGSFEINDFEILKNYGKI